MDKQDWASSHFQQTIRLLGAIQLDGVRHDFNRTGVRNHSRGPRNMSNRHSHVLTAAPFPSGRSDFPGCVRQEIVDNYVVTVDAERRMQQRDRHSRTILAGCAVD
jgi:hypothetical protein